METRKCADCGGDCVGDGFAAGYARTPDGRSICYPCANAAERAAFAGAAEYFCYLSGDGRSATTWPGGELARVTETSRHRGGFGGEYFSVSAVAPDGSRWYGRGGGPGMYLRLRRRRVAR